MLGAASAGTTAGWSGATADVHRAGSVQGGEIVREVDGGILSWLQGLS